MPFVIPSFPLLADVYAGPWNARVFRLQTQANLAPGRRVYQLPAGQDAGEFIATQAVTLLVPKGTDVRDCSCSATDVTDVVECPSGSGRWYGVQVVDDVGKGFPNEHRYVLMSKIFFGLNNTEYPGLVWPTPIP